MTRGARRSANERGQILVEAVMTLTLLLALFLGLMQLALVYVAHSVVDLASFQSARKVLNNSSSSQPDREHLQREAMRICRYIPGEQGSPKDATTVSVIDAGRNSGEVTVVVSHRLTLHMPIVGTIFSGAIEPSNAKDRNAPSKVTITKRSTLPKPW